MKHLFVVRHGDYNYNLERDLSKFGRVQMRDVGGSIRVVMDGMPIYIMSSSALRAFQSSAVIAYEVPCVGIEKIDSLWTGTEFGLFPPLEPPLPPAKIWRRRLSHPASREWRCNWLGRRTKHT